MTQKENSRKAFWGDWSHEGEKERLGGGEVCLGLVETDKSLERSRS